MEDNQQTLLISANAQIKEEIKLKIEAENGSYQVMNKVNLNGDSATVIIVATLAIQALPAVLGYIKDRSTGKQIKKIKFKDIEIENPTPELIEKLLIHIHRAIDNDNPNA